ncbi:MAG: glycosyltransferase family 4 protein [Acidimicrobiales bacterium]
MKPTGLGLSLDVSAVPARPGGVGYYTMELARSLATRPDVTLTMVSRRGDEDRWQGLAGGRAGVTGAVPRSRPGRLAFEQLRFPGLLRSLGVDVHHGPHYTMPERARVPCVVTIHDCTFFDHPEWHLRSKAVLFRRAIRRASLRAAALVCVSEVTATALRASCEVRAPVVVAPHGVDHERFAPAEPGPGADRAALEGAGVPLERPVIAFVGTLEPRKGVAPLVAAFDRVAASHPDVVLVLGGQVGWGMREIEGALAAARHADRIIRVGYLPDPAVPALLRRAAVVAYPALAEGFGLPALEAMACGAPLVTTEGTAMAEVARDAALLVRPGDAAMLAEALQAVLDGGTASTDTAQRRARGLRLAAAHTWEASATRHVEAYEIARAGH